MPEICICVEMVFGDASLADKARRVTQAGFRAIEFWLPDAGGDRKLEELGAACKETGLAINDMVLNGATGEPVSLVKSADREAYVTRLRQFIPLARKLNCRKFITCTGNRIAGVADAAHHRSIVDILKAAAKVADSEGVTLLLEPLNSLVDHGGYYLDSGHEAAQIVQEVDSPAVRLLWDIYHMQIMHGNVLANIEQYLPFIGHFHSAGVPGRHELNVGELDYHNILAAIEAWGYQGRFGLEYRPAGNDHAASLRQMRELTVAAGWA